MNPKVTTSGKKHVLLIIETSRGFGRGLLRGISHHILEHDEWIVHVEDRGLLESTPSWIHDWKGDGIISRTSSFPIHRAICRHQVPIVELLGNGRQVRAEVRSDEDQVASCAVKHLHLSGFSNFAFFSIGNAWWAQLRQEAFEREVRVRHGNVYLFPLAGRGPRVFYPAWKSDFNDLMLQWLKKLPRPAAIWSVSDALAIRLLEGCRRLGFSVPGEIAILGTTNDVLLCNTQTPSLSSIDLNSFRIGYTAAERLSRKMQRKGDPEEPLLLIPPTGVVVRRSTESTFVSDPELVEMLRFIRENATRSLTVKQLAEQFCISRSTLRRRFLKELGYPAEQEIIRVRMERARRLLCETNFTLSAIAAKTGFATTDYFVQAFRRENGCTPAQYRRQNSVTPDHIIQSDG
ncbi:MAG: DNA-binding transcriptional regulator [Planctomycetia bacterium]|nr:DNA-binding transcriptional regulator [Planctomycetia bacterium]